MNIKHTPGPWRSTLTFRKDEAPEPSVYAKSSVPSQFNGELVVLCGNGENAEANAALIAAAPELLEAAKRALKMLVEQYHVDSSYVGSAANKLSEAIAKAEGK